MIDFLYSIFNGNIPEILGDLYTPVCAAVVACWSIIGVGGAVTAFVECFRAIFGGIGGGKQ